ncbi:MAG TPA: hypothetical protein VF601_08635 [Beijerinckiaceae bacterium]|jgi:hypothetical protein
MWLTSLFARPAADDVQRQRRASLLYSILTVLLPLLVVTTGMFVLKAVHIDKEYIDAITKAILDTRSYPPVDSAQSAIADITGRFRFAAAHTLLVITAYVGVAAGIVVAVSALRDNGGLPRDIGILALAVMVATLLFALCWKLYGLNFVPGIKVRDFFIYLTPEMLAKSGYQDALKLLEQLERRGGYGGAVAIAAAGSLTVAAMVLAYRWRTPVWRQPRLLQRQFGSLLTLFAISSVLLVVSNTAVRSLLEWPVRVLPPSPDGKAASLLEPVRGMAGAMSYWWSVISTAVLLATFLPAFVRLMTDFNLAAIESLRQDTGGSTGGSPSGAVGDPTAKEIKDWKERHGLLMSSGEITTAIIASAAPLLTAPTIDLAKSIVAPS